MNLVEAGKARTSHAAILSYLNELVEIAKLPPGQQFARLEQLGGLKSDRPSVLRFLFSLAGKDERQIVWAYHSHFAFLRSAIVALAAERYRREHQHWPNDLAALVPEYLGEIPADPYDGIAIRYVRIAEGVVIYAVGPDGTDDGGNLPLQAKPTFGVPADGTDVGFRLWDVEHRREPAAPKAEREDP
jgi:hypothetical protein